MSSIFGWSYPPGCSSVPGDEVGCCEMCGHADYSCVCEDCPVCGKVGDRECYSKHGMVITQEQIDGLMEVEDMMDDEAERAEAEAEYYANHRELEEEGV